MSKTSAHPTIPKLLAIWGLTFLFSLSALADTVFVTSFTGSTLTVCPPYCANPLGLSGASISSSGTTAIATPPGAPTRTRATFGFAGAVNWSIQTPPLAIPGGVYTIEVAHTSASSCSADVVMSAFSTDGTVSASCTNSGVFQRAYNDGTRANDGTQWMLMGYITNNPTITQPTITFYYVSGTVNNTGTGRVYIDAFKFTYVDPCLPVKAVTVNGPLIAGQTTVNVSGVAAQATEVDVYANGGLIGSTNSTGLPAGTIPVTVSALLGGQTITAKQLKGSCDGGFSSALPVGGGANPTLQVALALGKSNTLSGPIAAPSGPYGYDYWIHADGRRSFGYAVAPTGGYVITPSTNWVSLVFNSDTDTTAGKTYDWQANVTPYTNSDNWAILSGLALAIDDQIPDIGPYKIYIDSIYNGTNLIQGFEASSYGTSYTNGTYGVMFLRPSASGSTSAWLASPPDTNYVNNAGGVNADTGTNSLAVEWVFKDTSIDNWVRLYTGGSGTPYPQVDLHQPITVRMLVLPVGEKVGRKFHGNVSFMTNSLPGFWLGTSNTLGVAVTGAGTYSYQWAYNHNDIAGATDAAYTLQPVTGITAADAGLYTVTVTDEGGGSFIQALNVQNIGDPIPTITNQLASAVLVAGTPASLSIGVDGHVPWGYPLSYQWYHNGNPVGTSSPTYAMANPQTADAGAYQVVASNTYGAVTSAVAFASISTVALGTGTGLRAEYYTLCTNGVNNFVGASTLTRVDPMVNFDWGTAGSPAASISADYFMARWSGQVQALGTDTYTFKTISDDGVRLWVNGQPIINNWTAHSPTTNSGSILLTGNQKYDLMMEYFEQGGGAIAKLLWANASGNVTDAPVPQSQLYPASGSVIPALTTSVTGTTLSLNWTAGTYTVVGAGKVTGPYTNVAVGATSPYTISIGAQPQMYYRLKVQ
jgi:hypothetical protein